MTTNPRILVDDVTITNLPQESQKIANNVFNEKSYSLFSSSVFDDAKLLIDDRNKADVLKSKIYSNMMVGCFVVAGITIIGTTFMLCFSRIR